MSIQPEKLPPTLADTSPLANGIALTRDPLAFFTRLQHEVGDFAHYVLSDRVVYFVNDVRLVREILITHESRFAKWAFNESFRAIFGKGLIGSHGDLHSQMRKIAHPPMQPSRLGRYVEIIVELTHKRLEGWREGQIDLSREMTLLTLEVIARALFSVPLGARAETILQATETLLRLNTKLGGAAEDVAAFEKANQTIADIAQEVIDEAKSAPEDGGLLPTLLAAHREGLISAEQLREEVRTFILAGHVTTAQSLACAFWLVAQQPDAQKRIREEVEAVLGGKSPRLEDIPRLSFCEAVMLETIRLYPPVWVFGREALVDVQLDGFKLTAGRELVICPWMLHRNPKIFPEPESFKPERWENGARTRLPRGSYLPFSTGARNCLGEHFAMMESILVLASVVQEWKFRELPERPDPGWTPQLLYWPRRGIQLDLARSGESTAPIRP
jgi:cytochrome P450